MKKKELPREAQEELLATLKARFEKNMHRHSSLSWTEVQTKLEANPDKLWSLDEMESSGGEPDVVELSEVASDELIFIDCSGESPIGRRSCCYDLEAWESRKEHKPKNTAQQMAAEMGIEILSEDDYRMLQKVGKFDSKTSSWIETPESIRKLGGALFCDRRYEQVFVYHNGAESYYAARGFRGMLRI